LLFDLREKIPKGGLIAGVPSKHFVSQRKTLRRHDERDHHLHAVRSFVPAVAILSLALTGRIAFEIGAGQVIEQYIEARIEQGFPALL